MPKQVRSTRSRPAKATTRRVARGRKEQVAQGQLEKAVGEIEKAIGDIRHGLARAEQRIEADARQRIRTLQKEGRAQMRALEGKRREATRLIGRLSDAAGGSWDDITKGVLAIVADARRTAGAVVARFRGALS